MIEFKDKDYVIINNDCLNAFKNIEDKSVDLILIDPPYNIGKDKKWDKWKTVNAYIDFMGQVFKECERVLKDNGSFYFFHNDFLQIVELQNWINKNTDFVFKQLLVWNKRFNEASNKGFLDGFIEVEKLRNYQKMAEYCLYYTFQDESGLTKINNNPNCYRSIKDYLLEERNKTGLSTKKLIDLSGDYLNKKNTAISHYFTDSQFMIPTENVYKDFLQVIGKKYNAFQKPYEELRKEYEELRYTYNNLKEHHSVMNYEIAKKQGHITPKPVDLLEYIIKTSSNKGDVVLDCFMGSGSTGVACLNTGRKFIGIEKEEKYFNIAKDRIEEAE